jgi:hypothetical protein
MMMVALITKRMLADSLSSMPYVCGLLKLQDASAPSNSDKQPASNLD